MDPKPHSSETRAYYRWRRRQYPERFEAAAAVKKALERGELVRPDACSRCDGTTGRDEFGFRVNVMEAHHESYAPEHHLDVTWLCRSCHQRRHNELRAERGETDVRRPRPTRARA